MGKIIKFLFIYILFFNTLFFGVSESMATSLKDSVIGPRDRVRSFVNGEIEFKYSKDAGFSCRPAGLKSYPNRNEFKSETDYGNTISSKIKGFFSDSNRGNDIAAYLESMFFDIFLQPVFCITFLEGLLDSGSFVSGKDEEDNDSGDPSGTKSLLSSMGAVLKIILSVVGVNSMAYLAKLILGEDDYNIDPTNPYCMGYYISEMVTCLVSLIVWKLNIAFGKKIIVILSLNVAYYVAKMIASRIIFNRAQDAFKQLSLCGDDWNVYGDLELQAKLDEEISMTGKSTDVKNIDLGYLKKYYPSKGVYPGSHQYLLDECFLNRNREVCRKLFGLSNDIEITNTTIDNNSNVIQKAYREFKYGGVEFAFNTGNNDCVDPRPERAGYMGTPDLTSQLYYFRGNEPANFACDRFLVKNNDAYKKAYRCCLEASQKLICIVNKEGNTSMHTMCSKNSSCSVKSNIDLDDASTGVKLKCADIKKALTDADLGEDVINSTYSNFCDENDNLKPVYGYEYSAVEDDGKGLKGAGAGRIEFKIRQSAYDENKYCVETYNLCPYNFKLMGGSEEFGDEFKQTHEENIPVKETEKNSGIYIQKTLSKKVEKENEDRHCVFTKEGVKDCYGACHSTATGVGGTTEDLFDNCYNRSSNFCQMNRHCVTITPIFEREKPNTSPYVDEACINLVGSSHNYDNYINMTDRPRHSFFLTAPVVECVVETAKNVLMNKAGHTKCRSGAEEPIENSCPDTGELYKKGKVLDEELYPSSFQRLRKYFLNITRLLMVLAVVLYGYSYLIQQKGFSSSEEIMKFLLKLMIVSYFATSTNWINPVFSGVYAVYGEVSQLAVKLVNSEPNYDSPKYNGCYFIKSKYIDNNYEDYGDRGYISLFDTLDCKLSRYFGFYVNAATNPPIVSLIIAGVLTFGIAIILILPLLLLFVGLLYFTASVALSFMVSSFTVTILLLIAPIMIPQLLFDKTKDNVMKWLKAIVRNIFSPLFLVMGMFIFFTVFDKYFVGDAVFNGKNEPIRNVYCGVICKISDEQFSYVNTDELSINYDAKHGKTTYSGKEAVNCVNNLRGKIVELSKNSLLCVLQKSTKQTANTGIGIINFIINDFKGLPGLFLQVAAFFNCFLDIVFLLIIIFIFNQFIPYIDSLTNTIFSGGAGVDDKLSMTLKEMMKSVASKGAKFANKTKDYGSGVILNKGINKFNQWRDRRIGDPKGGGDGNGTSTVIGTNSGGANKPNNDGANNDDNK